VVDSGVKDRTQGSTDAPMGRMNYMSGWFNVNRAKSGRYDHAPQVTALVNDGKGHHLETISDPWLVKYHTQNPARKEHLDRMGLLGYRGTPAKRSVQGQSARSAIRLPDIQAPAKYRCFSMSATEWTLMQRKVTRKEEKARAKKAQRREPTDAPNAAEEARVQTLPDIHAPLPMEVAAAVDIHV